ncbi:MAG: hypothetical protein M1826_005383 [Phylliscum demangeonii]|nr:MAG: hypothetical protein M1826_005383 [Phylliscum demangeonii]
MKQEVEDETFNQNYRRNPPEDENFSQRGHFKWPEAGYAPDVLLGKNLEALDPIRVREHVFITFDPKESWIEVYSNNEEATTNAVVRVRATCFEIIARSMPTTRVYMIDMLDPTITKRGIELVPYERFIGQKASGGSVSRVVPVMTGPAPTDEELSKWVLFKPSVPYANLKCIKRAAHINIIRMRYYRGHVRMRIVFGVLPLSSYKLPEEAYHSLDDFFAMVRNEQTAGRVASEVVGDEAGIALLAGCRAADHVLDPFDPVTPSLEDIAADFTASFDFGDIEKLGPARLEIGFARVVGADRCEIQSMRWLKVTPRGNANGFGEDNRNEKVPLSLVTLNLPRNTAWELAITCHNIIDELRRSTAMRFFADKVNLEVTENPKKGGLPTPRVYFPRTVLPLQGYTINTHYRHLVRGSRYVLEVTRSQIFRRTRVLNPSPLVGRRVTPAARTATVNQPVQTNDNSTGTADTEQSRTTWSATMYNFDWDSVLDRQLNLAIGVPGKWDPQLETFFPPVPGDEGRDGVKHFVSRVQIAAGLVQHPAAVMAAAGQRAPGVPEGLPSETVLGCPSVVSRAGLRAESVGLLRGGPALHRIEGLCGAASTDLDQKPLASEPVLPSQAGPMESCGSPELKSGAVGAVLSGLVDRDHGELAKIPGPLGSGPHDESVLETAYVPPHLRMPVITPSQEPRVMVPSRLQSKSRDESVPETGYVPPHLRMPVITPSQEPRVMAPAAGGSTKPRKQTMHLGATTRWPAEIATEDEEGIASKAPGQLQRRLACNRLFGTRLLHFRLYPGVPKAPGQLQKRQGTRLLHIRWFLGRGWLQLCPGGPKAPGQLLKRLRHSRSTLHWRRDRSSFTSSADGTRLEGLPLAGVERSFSARKALGTSCREAC